MHVTVKTALDRYNKTISPLKKSSQQDYWRINQLSRSFLGPMLVRDVTSVHIAQYRDERLATTSSRTKKRLSPSSVRLEMNLLQKFFDICVIEWRYIKSNPCKDVRKPKPAASRERRLTGREERKILDYAKKFSNSGLYSIFVLALETAMRQGEIIRLEWEHVDLKKRVVYLPETKNGTKREVPLSLKAKNAILRMRDGSHCINGHPSGRLFTYTSSGIKTTWQIMCKRLAIEDLNFHDMRHEAVSRLFETGRLDMMEIAAITGHKSLSMLKRYTHLQAVRLVKKLDGNSRNKVRQALLSRFQPYPAVFESVNGQVDIHFPDFCSLKILGQDPETAKAAASHLLTETLVKAALEDSSIPIPDSYLENYDSQSVVMVEPLYFANSLKGGRK